MAPLLLYLLTALIWGAAVAFLHRYRIWLLFYTVGSVGLAFLLIVAGTRFVPLERGLEVTTAYAAHAISQALGIPTRVFEAAPGNILVWVVVQEPGWTVVRVDLECSGLLEMSVLSGLLLFYPAWSLWRRLGLTMLGWVATYMANIARVVVIILILHSFGKRSIFVAHTIVGRAVFFALVAGLYWVVFTRGTLSTLAERLDERMRS